MECMVSLFCWVSCLQYVHWGTTIHFAFVYISHVMGLVCSRHLHGMQYVACVVRRTGLRGGYTEDTWIDRNAVLCSTPNVCCHHKKALSIYTNVQHHHIQKHHSNINQHHLLPSHFPSSCSTDPTATSSSYMSSSSPSSSLSDMKSSSSSS